MGFLDLKYEAFGLDINDLSIKIIKLEKKGNGFFLSSFYEGKIPSGVIEDGVIKNELALVEVIKLACNNVEGKKLKTKYVVASLPEEKSFLQVIQMPKMDDQELELAVPLEAENYIPLPMNEVYLDFQVIPPTKDYFTHLEVLIDAMPKKIIDSYVSCFRKAGLIPIALEAESEAIARALIKKETNSSLIILIDFGENNTDFIVFSGNSVRFTASIQISSQSITKAIAEALKIDFYKAEKLKIDSGLIGNVNIDMAERVPEIIKPILDDLTEQIKKYINFYHDHSSFEYFSPEGNEEKILLCGGGSRLKGLIDFMSEKLGSKIELGDPLINISNKRNKNILNKDLTSSATAIGLALRKIDK